VVKRTGRVTIEEVATACGVSRQTVSNAVNFPERLAESTLARVRAAITGLGYRPDRSARTMVRGQAGQIGFCVRNERSEFMTSFLTALCAALADRGSHVLLFTASRDEELSVCADLLAQRAVDGFVLADVVDHDERQRWLHGRGVPFVSFGRTWSGSAQPGPWVDVDGAGAIAEVVLGLHGLGHERIAFLDWAGSSGAAKDRGRGCAAACRDLGLAPPLVVEAAGDDPVAAEVAIRHALVGQTAPTAVVGATDALAVGAARAASAAGLRVGQDLAVTGFDDSALAAAQQPALTSVRQPLDAIVAGLAQRLRDPTLDGLVVAGEVVSRESAPIAAAAERSREPSGAAGGP
jgi:DNA-binding LacI/PurR family transcriptional regulator